MGVNGRRPGVWGALGAACILVAVLGLVGIAAAVPQAGVTWLRANSGA